MMPRKVTLFPLIAAIYLMVAGGPFGLEDIVSKSGYAGAIAILLATPVVWSLPTALMVSELASALPSEGGYYVWVTRAMGRFWGFQEAWLSLAGSVFDMAIYPTLFVDYLGHFAPTLTAGGRGIWIGVALIAAVRAMESAGREDGGWKLAGADHRAAGSIRGSGGICRLPPRGARRAGRSASRRRYSGRHTRRHVELHGMGQCFDHRR
jgi:amino acid transporter